MRRLVITAAALLISKSLSAVAATVQWNSATATRYVYYAYSVMCGQEQVMNWSCVYCNKIQGFTPLGFHWNQSTDNSAYYGVNHGNHEIVIGFRGTKMNSIVNWLNDLSVGFTPIIPGNSAQVHPGFLNIYQSHKNFLFPAVTNLIAKYPDYDVIATGHSMGGSSATLFSFDMFKNYGISKTKLVTFGSPRVGNADFRKQFISSGISSWRFTNMNDIVPHLPLSMQGFQHVSNEIFQTTSNGVVSYKICNDANGEDPSCANKQILLGIQDHTHYMGVFSGMCANIAQK